jgi:hypothetical protein
MSKSTNHRHRDRVSFEDKSNSSRRLEHRRQAEKEDAEDMREALQELDVVNTMSRSQRMGYW